MVTIFNEDTAKLALKMDITTKFFRALGDPARLTILDSLRGGEKNVGELVGLVGLSQGRVSSHLACLKQCGFVDTRRDGKLVYYSIADESVHQLLRISQQMIAKNAERIWACTQVVSNGDSGNDAATCPSTVGGGSARGNKTHLERRSHDDGKG